MVVRTKRDRIPPIFLFGVAGGFVAFVTVVFAVRSVVIPDPVPTCGESYPKANILAYSTQSRGLLSPVDLQSKLRERDWGLVDNSHIVKTAHGDYGAALEVMLPSGGHGGGTANRPVSGVGFKWAPGFLATASAACATYSVFLPDGFSFGTGGVLPGLFGAARDGRNAGFAVQMRWLAGGKLGYRLTRQGRTRHHDAAVGDRYYRLPRGRWVDIAQEVRLNTPGKQDGTLRIWADGDLKVNQTNVTFGPDGETVRGVVADTHFTQPGSTAWAPAPVDTRIMMTPFILRWGR